AFHIPPAFDHDADSGGWAASPDEGAAARVRRAGSAQRASRWAAKVRGSGSIASEVALIALAAPAIKAAWSLSTRSSLDPDRLGYPSRNGLPYSGLAVNQNGGLPWLPTSY